MNNGWLKKATKTMENSWVFMVKRDLDISALCLSILIALWRNLNDRCIEIK
jgi:hypothetical protein